MGFPMKDIGNSKYFCHPRKWLAGIHPKRTQDRCPITNVGHDGRGMDSRYKMSGMTQKKKILLAILSKGTC
jgi:hypothetical protein